MHVLVIGRIMYKQRVEYDFEVGGERLAITDFARDYVCVEETRKNGQEDCHMSGVLVYDGISFVWDEGEHSFVEYHSQELADGIREFINSNGLPSR